MAPGRTSTRSLDRIDDGLRQRNQRISILVTDLLTPLCLDLIYEYFQLIDGSSVVASLKGTNCRIQ